MTSIANFLPRPKNTYTAQMLSGGNKSEQVELVDDDELVDDVVIEPAAPPRGPPPYRQRKNWIPRTQADFGDGGSFPEVHVAQYPLQLGRKKRQQTGNTVALRVDETGSIRYDAIAQVGHFSKDLIQHSIKSLKPIDIVDGEYERPSEQVVDETTEKTKKALDSILDVKIRATKPKSIEVTSQAPQYIKYKPQQAEAGISERIIRMVELPVDPLEPPRFRHKKIPKGPGSPPAPVMHSPPRKISVEEQRAWFIPPCISNWKNAKGYTIPLDKRLAADGRDLREVKINDNFAKLAEALYIADRNAREEVTARAKMQKKLAEKEKEKKEAYLRDLAQKARVEREELEIIEERAVADVPGRNDRPQEDETVQDREREREDRETYYEVKQRERLRREKEKEIRREIRLANTGKGREDRDVSEKIALGMAKPTLTGESLYDQRLFNRTQGLSSGFGAEESYSLYDKPLFQTNNSIYKPKNLDDVAVDGIDVETALKSNKFVPDRGFSGTQEPTAEREGPVQFVAGDPFELDEFLSTTGGGGGGDKRAYGLDEPAAASSSKRAKPSKDDNNEE